MKGARNSVKQPPSNHLLKLSRDIDNNMGSNAAHDENTNVSSNMQDISDPELPQRGYFSYGTDDLRDFQSKILLQNKDMAHRMRN